MRDSDGIRVRIWGIVKDRQGNRCSGIQLRLLKGIKKNKRIKYQVIQEGISDQNGVYAFYIEETKVSCYKVIALNVGEKGER